MIELLIDRIINKVLDIFYLIVEPIKCLIINKYIIGWNKKCGGGEIRTLEGLCHWILSPAPLTAVTR